MGNALYTRMATRSDATGATVEPIPMPRTAPGVHIGRIMDPARAYPSFRKRHAGCGTDDDPRAPFFVVTQHQLLRYVGLIQIQFALFTLYIWNYLSGIRFFFGSDEYPDKVPLGMYQSWVSTGGNFDAQTAAELQYPSSDMRWVGLVYLACSVAGLVSAVMLTLFMLWENSSLTEHAGWSGNGVFGPMIGCVRRWSGLCRDAACCCCGASSSSTSPHKRRVHHSTRKRDDRVYLERPIFVYGKEQLSTFPSRDDAEGPLAAGGQTRSVDFTRSHEPPQARSILALDAHAAHHQAYGDEYRGDVAPLLVYVAYVFVLPLCVIDLAVVSDLTLSASPGPQGRNATMTGDSYGSAKLGSGMGALQGFVMIVGLLFVLIPPRRWYQRKAEAYLAERYY